MTGKIFLSTLRLPLAVCRRSLASTCTVSAQTCSTSQNDGIQITRRILRPFRPTFRHYAAPPAVAKKAAALKSKGNFNVGTIGHVDHGKTTLTAAITKVLSGEGKAKFTKYEEIDKGAEEKRRGITINIAHLGYETKARRYAHTDCPGHRDFIKNMIFGTSQMDAAILVLAATDGTMPQTREHLMLAKQIGVENLIVYINKSDVVDNDTVELVELEIRETLEEYGFDGENIPVIKGSALCALEDVRPEIGVDSIHQLLSVLDGLPQPSRDLEGSFIMPVHSGFTVTGRGCVVVGTIEKGTLRKGDKVDLVGYGSLQKTTCSDIHIFKQSVTEAYAGDHVGVLCRGLKSSDVRKGLWMVRTGHEVLHNSFRAELYSLTEEEGGMSKGLKSEFMDKMIFTTWSQAAKISLPPEIDLLMPGEFANVIINTLRPMPLEENMRFTFRKGEHTPVAGRVYEILPNEHITNADELRAHKPFEKLK